ncbi:FHA domain-containing protein FhaB/FipA [Corynebacterium pygosceleis]|uniref:FHA domain-containing protein FhaB/FipA n=1 Tax=Corynebacterium pygosceleis TaxID=2800406 RepID=UPI00300E5C50
MLLALRMGLLVLLWFFVLMALRALRSDVRSAAGVPGARSERGAGGGLPLTRSAPPRRLMAVGGPSEGTWIDLTGLNEILIGRDPHCTFVVGDDSTTRQHARLFRHSDEWFIEDLASRNGTFVAGTPIEQPERVGTDTNIDLGTTTVRLVP